VVPGSDPPVVNVENVGADPGAAVVEDPWVSAIEISWPGTPPVIEDDVTFPERVITKELKAPAE
jgi:hypothetical protein